MLADARARNTSYLPTYPLTEPRRGPRGGLCEKDRRRLTTAMTVPYLPYMYLT